MLIRFLAGLFGETKGVFVIGRKDQSGNDRFLARPGVVVIDDDKIRFRNFTAHKVRITASFLEKSPVTLEPREDDDRGNKADRIKLDLKPGVSPGFYEYSVTVLKTPEEDAIGDSRPGAIIDR